MRKHRLLLPLALLLAFLLAGCHYAVLSIENASDSEWSCRFQLKGGTDKRTISISEGETPEIRFAVELSAGTLAITITDDGGGAVFTAVKEDSESFTVPLESAGSYQIALTTDKASGSYHIGWGDPPEETEESGS